MGLSAILDRFTPAIADLEVRRRARVIAGFTLLIQPFAAFTVLMNLAGGKVTAAGVLAAANALMLTTLPLLRAGWIRAAGHVSACVAVSAMVAVAVAEGGLVSTGITWQASAVVLCGLVLGPTEALPWLGVQMASVFWLASRFDPADWSGEQGSVWSFAVSIALAYGVAWAYVRVFHLARVEAFTALEARNADMRRVLDHVAEALVTIDRRGVLAAERSTAAVALLGAHQPGRTLWEALDAVSPGAGTWLACCWDELIDGVLPRELAVAQLPNRVKTGEATWAMSITPIETFGRINGALVVLRDISVELAKETSERDQRDLMRVLEVARTDRRAVHDFLSETGRLARGLRSSDRATALRDLHTIKGNAGILGLSGVAEQAHAVESAVAERGNGPTEAERDQVVGRWEEVELALRTWNSDRGPDDPWPEDVGELVAAIQRGASHVELPRLVAGWGRTPVPNALGRLRGPAELLARKLGKSVVVTVTSPPVRVEGEAWDALFSSLVHVVRNAIDHGVETPEERAALGKPATAELQLVAEGAAGGLNLHIIDDGRGVDWGAVRARALALGLPAETRDELVEAMFSDGLSTRDGVDQISGRGVGLSAVKAAITTIGGQLAVDSDPGNGTRLSIWVPLAGPVQSPQGAQAIEGENSLRPRSL